ncbi:hypothetical protein A9Q91_02740 [Candidatus Gracilibacteria bacterium 28_42_T64]|nr:hypothetical protein A9Q91_02740 [Candidatus Gracilibacteria bacterium 28_42_T64]
MKIREFTEVDFYECEGNKKILPQIIFTDPGWFFDTLENGGFKKGYALLKQAEYLNERARNIRIPKDDPSQWRVEYILTVSGEYQSFSIVENNLPKRTGLENVIESDRINMYFPMTLPGYCKEWYIPFMSDLISSLFGKQKKLISGELSEIFFCDDSNFKNNSNFKLDLPPRRGLL